MSGPSVLVTGATGFIGRWSVPALLQRGYQVHAVGCRVGPSRPSCPGRHRIWRTFSPPRPFPADREICPSHLLHFAWYTVPGAYWNSLDNFSWVGASLHLVQRFHAAGGRRAVIAGTCAEYDWSRARLCEETSTPGILDAPAGATPYAICKAALQRMLDSYSRSAGLSLAWGRVFLQYGPYEPTSRLVSSSSAPCCGARARPAAPAPRSGTSSTARTLVKPSRLSSTAVSRDRSISAQMARSRSRRWCRPSDVRLAGRS